MVRESADCENKEFGIKKEKEIRLEESYDKIGVVRVSLSELCIIFMGVCIRIWKETLQKLIKMFK